MGTERMSAFQEITAQEGKHLAKYSQGDHRLKNIGQFMK